nr:hypothetical protein [uncultured Pseudomonas sp.]
MLKNVYIAGAINQIIKIAVGPCLLISITHYLSIEEQGYWYFFLGFIGFFMLAELGVLTVCGNFSAHESKNLTSPAINQGNLEDLKAASAILAFSLRWISSAGLFYIFIIGIFGAFLMTLRSSTAHWQIPWIIIVISAYLNLRNLTLLSFMEGIGLITKSQLTKCAGTLAYLLTTLALLISGMGIFSLALGYLAGSTVTSLLIKNKFGHITSKLLLAKNSEKKKNQKLSEITKKSALCSIGGCLSFQSISIIAFCFYDEITAGRIGITLGLFSVMYALSSTLISLTMPKIGRLFSEGKNFEARRIAIIATTASLLSYLSASTFFFIIVSYSKLPFIQLVTDRMADNQSTYIATLCWIPQLMINGIAGYVRSQRKEPFAAVSLFSGIYIASISTLIATHLNESYLLAGLLSSYLFTLPWFIRILVKEEKYSGTQLPADISIV